MKKGPIILTFAVVILMAGLIGCPPPPLSSSATMLELKVVPPDAAVIVDGKLVGNSWDMDKIEITPGSHTIEIRKKGFEPYKKDIYIGLEGALLEVELEEIE